MIFLRASESMWLVESQRTRRSRASRARRIRSTCFFRQAIEVSGVRDNCHCPAFRLLVCIARKRFEYTYSCTRPPGVGTVPERKRMRCERCRTRECGVRLARIKVHGECCYGAHRLPAGRTAARDEARDVLPFRQSNSSMVDYCRCPRHQPHLWRFEILGACGAGSQRTL